MVPMGTKGYKRGGTSMVPTGPTQQVSKTGKGTTHLKNATSAEPATESYFVGTKKSGVRKRGRGAAPPRCGSVR